VKILKVIIVENKDVLIDDEDYEYLFNCYDMKITDHGYVYCSPKKKWKGKMALFSMTIHKLLMNPDKRGRSIVVDHRDGNKLNNQKDNLRVCTHEQNMRNRKPQGGKSEYKGVYKHHNSGLWSAQTSNKGSVYKGLFSTEVAAANCYNYWSKIEYGEFALLNDVPFMNKEEWESFQIIKNKTSVYRGVSFFQGKWLAQICHKGKHIKIGSFNEEEIAALEYDKIALELKGNKAKLNFQK
jgi:hypothetical protein